MKTEDLKLHKVYRATNKYHDEFFNVFTGLGDIIEYISISLLDKNKSVGTFSFKRSKFDREIWTQFSLEDYNMSERQKHSTIMALFEE